MVLHAAVIRLELRIPAIRSLKEKRRVLTSISALLRQRHGLSVAEVDHQDLWQRATLGLAVVASSPAMLESQVQAARQMVERRTDVEIIGLSVRAIEDPDE